MLRSSPAWDGPGFVALVEFPQPVVHAVEAQAAVAQAPATTGPTLWASPGSNLEEQRGPHVGLGKRQVGSIKII